MRLVFSPSNPRIVFSAAGVVPPVNMWCRLRQWIFDSYRPELHYMRGPGPKWREKQRIHARESFLNASQRMNRRARSSVTLSPLPVRATNAVLFSGTMRVSEVRAASERV
jgi:hypothetical protein